MRPKVIIFVKAPLAGRVKTRLGAAVGMARAAAVAREMIARTIAEAQKGDWETLLAVDPPSAVAGFENLWPPSLRRIPQGQGDLGDRMARVMRHLPPGPVVIIGADAPALRARHLRQAFRALAGADAVFGPAHDGGYWLIGLARRRPAPDIFADVRWSTEHALADTIRSLPQRYLVRRLELLRDIDEARDLAFLGLRSTAR